MAPADPDRILRLLPLFAGIVGGTVLMFNRFATADLTPSQARSDVMGVILSGVLILVGLIWQRVQPRLPDAVELIGREGLEFAPDLPEPVKIELAWASHLLLTNTATKSLIVYYQGQVLLRRGILSQNSEVKVSNIIKRVLETGKAVYLVNLNLYPAKIEFDYLPENTQGLICQPIGKEGVLILAANAPRSYTKQDEIWIEGIADKLANTFSQF
ncbi:MAG: cofactor assembly of complex C subunit B [Microcystis wesenbergii TW10]|uniref:Cofactor assembly of complex C subunit B n=1 Tax=Microcystis wesenbergii TW10 TaxID=2060474 RepID=A0A3E0M3A4_9CHRO|nr:MULTISPECIES: cofactor assembly of complex C subunit B [unclassified Microcystis]MCZ8037875.1 cofactor assembly of complex C subunit B [Microcystis sp. LE17-20A]MCZ8213860.1 cofactor assembly of complex C subunit B [Microcystis sp. LE19-8.1F]REJ54240.1 MAG: cofactor assembly of complex C subunit B [Microcystis wesenbergii TW10]